MKKNTTWRKPAVIITAFLLLLSTASLLYLLVEKDKSDYAAEIFQDGVLIICIYLNDISQAETLTIQGVRPGSIAIISADCPDKLCVRQGFISDSKLPVTCLPNRLVIRLRPVSDSSESTAIPDAVTY